VAQVSGEMKAQRVAAMFARISRRYDFMNTIMTGGGRTTAGAAWLPNWPPGGYIQAQPWISLQVPGTWPLS